MNETPQPMLEIDEDAAIAAIALAHRSGATGVEFGHLDDDVPVEDARWWAHAQYQGARLQVELHRGPVEALEALARRILHRAKCVGCGRTVRIGGMADGCRWTREGRHWMPACPGGRARLIQRIAREEASDA